MKGGKFKNGDIVSFVPVDPDRKYSRLPKTIFEGYDRTGLGIIRHLYGWEAWTAYPEYEMELSDNYRYIYVNDNELTLIK